LAGTHSRKGEKEKMMADSSVIVWGQGEPVVLIHPSAAADPAFVWPQQRSLAEHYQLLFLTRPGYGKRPVQPRRDVAEDIREASLLLEAKGSGHLVGLSYGGIVALGAAARNPAVVRSLTVLEPPAFAVARGNAAVEALVEQLKRPYAAVSTLTPEEFLRGFLSAFSGQEPLEGFILEPSMRKDVQAMMAEPPPWELEIPLDMLAATPFPKLVVTGNWSPAFDAVAEVLTRRLHAQHLICEGAGHNIAMVGEALNEHLMAFWQR
jgi:pimeloyl-ACP methyl ester carboxylesterase